MRSFLAKLIKILASSYQVYFRGRGLFRFLLLEVLTISLIVACNPGNLSDLNNVEPLTSGEDCQVIEHDFGDATICGEPQRIVALGPNILDSLLALGGQPAGYADIAQVHQGDFDNPPEQIPYLGKLITTQPVNLGRSGQPSFDALTQLQPDLIIGGVTANQVDILTGLKPR